LQDAQNSTRALTDDSGAITQSYNYSAYGDLLGGTAANTNYLYTGQRLDAITGDYYLRARQYDPNTGRFLSRDTWPLDYDYPVELNRYVYAAANPIMYADPSGYFAETGWLNKFSSGISARAKTYFVRPFAEGFFAGVLGHAIGWFIFNMIVDEWSEYNPIEAVVAGGIGGAFNVWNNLVSTGTSTSIFSRRVRIKTDSGKISTNVIEQGPRLMTKLAGYGLIGGPLFGWLTQFTNSFFTQVDAEAAGREIAIGAVLNLMNVAFDYISEIPVSGPFGDALRRGGRAFTITAGVAVNVVGYNLGKLAALEE